MRLGSKRWPCVHPACIFPEADIRKQIFVICAVAFLFSAGIRLLEYPRWDPSSLNLDGEWLLATHDAYFWVAGAEGVNPIAKPMPMAVLLDALSRIFPTPHANLAFWVSILLAALVAIPVALWCYFLAAPRVAILVPLLATLAPAFYSRTRLGYYDTDWAALFFPLMISWLLGVWIRSHLRTPEHNDRIGTDSKANRNIAASLILLTAIAMPWHNLIGLYLIAVLGIAFALVLLLGIPEDRPTAFLTLLAIALVVGTGWMGAVVSLLLLWLARGYPGRFRDPGAARLMGTILVILLILITGLRFREYLSMAIPVYAGKLFGQGGSQAEGLTLVFPDLTGSVRETQSVTLIQALEGMAFHTFLGIAGIVGYLVLLLKRPAAAFLLPLLALGLSSVRLGIRFTMFASPAVWLGLLVPLGWVIARTDQRRAWVKLVKVGLAVMIPLAIFPIFYQFSRRLPLETVVGKSHAEALTSLGEMTDHTGTIWTWWDYGYASQHFAGMKTFADGRRNTGNYLFSMGTVLGSDTLERSAEFIRFAARNDYTPWEVWATWNEAEWETWLGGLDGEYSRSDPLPAPEYLIVQWEGIPALSWIQYYGSWDFSTHEGQRSRAAKVVMPQELDLETGVFRFDRDQTLRVVTVDMLGGPEGQHYDYAVNAGGPHLMLNDLTGEVMLVDETAYRSAFIQLLILPVDHLEDRSPFTLLIDDQPFVRVFELR